jgi:hypothetical protein
MKNITDDEAKKGAFFYLAGSDVQKVFDQILEPHRQALEANQEMTYDYYWVIAQLNKKFTAGDNITVQKTILKNMNKNTGESMQSFANRLREQVAFCGFTSIREEEEAVKMQVLEKGENVELRKRALLENHNLEKVFELATSLETVQDYEDSLAGKSNDIAHEPVHRRPDKLFQLR